MIEVRYGRHTIKVNAQASLLGKEVVYYDGQVVSEKNSMLGATHTFSMREDGEDAFYEVQIGPTIRNLMPAPHITIRRNGTIIFTDKS